MGIKVGQVYTYMYLSQRVPTVGTIWLVLARAHFTMAGY